jgi:hypothetical protein
MAFWSLCGLLRLETEVFAEKTISTIAPDVGAGGWLTDVQAAARQGSTASPNSTLR